jgi:hypothetical protein
MRIVRGYAGGPLGTEHDDPADIRGSFVRLGVIDRETGPAIEQDEIPRLPMDVMTIALFDAARAPFQDKTLDPGRRPHSEDGVQAPRGTIDHGPEEVLRSDQMPGDVDVLLEMVLSSTSRSRFLGVVHGRFYRLMIGGTWRIPPASGPDSKSSTATREAILFLARPDIFRHLPILAGRLSAFEGLMVPHGLDLMLQFPPEQLKVRFMISPGSRVRNTSFLSLTRS